MNFGYTIYVFNCSPEMDYISMGNVLKASEPLDRGAASMSSTGFV